MTHYVDAVNQVVEHQTPALWQLLSELGRRSAYPPDIPYQAAQARGASFNATIGQITDGAGRGLALESLVSRVTLDEDAANRAFLYSPVEGSAELRRRWRERQRAASPTAPSTLPLVVSGLTHGLSLVADLFADTGRPVVVPAPFWGNYRQIFGLRRGARVLPAEVYGGGVFDPRAFVAPLAQIEAGEPAIVLANLPCNPVGYSPSAAERGELVAALVEAAEERPLLVVCDDAYAGLVYESDAPRHSLFWDLAGAHANLVPVKVDGCTKELVFFGGRVAFLSFAFEPGSEVEEAVESKCKCLIRATVGSPAAVSQEIVLAALNEPGIADEVEQVRVLLEERYLALKRALTDFDPTCGRPLPFNSGCFALIELPEGVEPEALRRLLLDELDTGVVSIAPRYVRLAYCSVALDAIAELVARVEAGVRQLSA